MSSYTPIHIDDLSPAQANALYNKEPKEKIRKAMEASGGCNGRIWKGYSPSTLRHGWHFEPTSGQIQFLGHSVAQAIETIEQLAEARSY
jgi:hypothetical protein